MDRKEYAVELKHSDYNCAQAVFCAFCDKTGLTVGQAARLSSSFGGGMGRLREVCGAMSGALLTLGYLYGYDDPGDNDVKHDHYRLVREFAGRFEERFGALRCKDLLKTVSVTPGSEPEARTPGFYEKRPCLRIVAGSAEILDELIAETDAEKPGEE